jgi:HPr kinase/phosphorylase
VEVRGLGTLLLGPSGIGKSECALELVRRGFFFVADDVVELTPTPDGGLIGRPSPQLGDHLEVRGLGILSMRDLFGADAVREEASVDLVCRLAPRGDSEVEFDRVGSVREKEPIGGAEVVRVILPALPAGTLATLVEVAARDQQLRLQGHNAAARFDAQLRERLRPR